MMPPSARNSDDADLQNPCSAASLRVDRIKKRADFLRASRAEHAITPGFILQRRRRKAGEADSIRVGFTCSKKVGNAVTRNRAKRRLRAIALQNLPTLGEPGADYVLIGRAGSTATRPFDLLQEDFRRALQKLSRTPR